jgi:hypothetical protein
MSAIDDEQLLDYEEEQEETNEHANKNDAAANGEATKKIKVRFLRGLNGPINNQ